MKSHEIDMTEGKILPKLLQYSMPIFLMSILQNLFNAADIVIVGKFADGHAMAAVGSSTTLLGFMVSLFNGLSTGNNILCARYYGKKDFEKLTGCLHTTVVMSLILSLPIAVFGILFAVPLLVAVNVDPIIMDAAVLYLRLYLLGIPADLIFSFSAAGVRATGNSRLPTQYLSIAGLVNLTLNCVFVIGFHMDVDGVALATVISKYLSLFLLLRFMFRTQDACKLYWKKLKIDKFYLRSLLQLGIPASINGSLASFSSVVTQSTCNAFGYAATAGNSAANSIMNFAYSAFGAVSSAVGCFAGQNIGAGKPKRIPQLLKRSIGMSLVFSVIFAAIFYFFGESLVSLYVASDDVHREEIIAQGVLKLLCAGVPICFYGVYTAQAGVLGGFGKTFMAMLVSLFSIFLVRICWCYLIFPFLPQQIHYLYIVLPISSGIAAILYGIAIFIVYKKHLRNMSPTLADR